jgi:hypothetical protein
MCKQWLFTYILNVQELHWYKCTSIWKPQLRTCFSNEILTKKFCKIDMRLLNLKISWVWMWRLLCSGLWCHDIWKTFTDTLEEHTVSSFRADESWNIKKSTRLHGITSQIDMRLQKMDFWILIFLQWNILDRYETFTEGIEGYKYLNFHHFPKGLLYLCYGLL